MNSQAFTSTCKLPTRTKQRYRRLSVHILSLIEGDAAVHQIEIDTPGIPAKCVCCANAAGYPVTIWKNLGEIGRLSLEMRSSFASFSPTPFLALRIGHRFFSTSQTSRGPLNSLAVSGCDS